MKIYLEEEAIIPERAHNDDAGLDLRSREDAVIFAGGSYIFDTGVHIALPSFRFFDGENVVEVPTEGAVRSKSGLNFKHNLLTDGTVDFSYRGSICVKLYNRGDVDYHVKRGDKIAQLVINPILTPKLEVVSDIEQLGETERADGGFGSTGR